MLVLVVGPSGAGKDTLMVGARAALAADGRVRFVRREITRGAEAGGEDHVAVDMATFVRRRAAGAYALSWEAHGLGYGVPADIAEDVRAGRLVVVNGSRGAIGEAAARFPVVVLEVTAPAEVLARRLAARGRETAEDIASRLVRRIDVPGGVEVVTFENDGRGAAGVAGVGGVLRERVGAFR